jgi:hypothetical protein
MERLQLIPEHVPAIVELILDDLKVLQDFELDYSPASLRVVNELILQWRGNGEPPDRISIVVFLLGMYLGEVIIRNVGGKWLATESLAEGIASSAGGAPFLLELPSGRICNPINRALRLMLTGSDADLVSFYEWVLTELAPGQWRPRQPGHLGLHNN